MNNGVQLAMEGPSNVMLKIEIGGYFIIWYMCLRFKVASNIPMETQLILPNPLPIPLFLTLPSLSSFFTPSSSLFLFLFH